MHLIDNRIRLLERHLKMAVLLELAFGGFPPLLPVVADDIRDENLLDLVHGGPAAVAGEDQFHQFQVVGCGELAQGLDIGGLARQNMVLRDGLEGFGSEGQIHRMPRSGLEIYGKTAENRVHRLNFAKPPTPVHTEAVGG